MKFQNGDAGPSNTGLQFGFCLAPRPPRLLEELDTFVRTAEDLGASLIGTGDSAPLFHDPFLLMNMIAERSHRAMLGTVMTVPGIRHPAVLAATLATLQEVSNGRAFLGIGTGNFGLTELKEAPWPLDRFVDYALAVRALARGDTAIYDGKELKLGWHAQPVPLWMGADGQRALRAAGKVADGVIVNGAAEGLVGYQFEKIGEGAREAGRTLADLDIWHMMRVHIADSEAQGIDDMAYYVARYVKFTYDDEKRMLARGIRVGPDIAKQLSRYLADYSEEQAYVPGSRYNVDLLVKHGLLEWAARRFLVTGTPSEVGARLRELQAEGVRKIIIPLMMPDYMKGMRDIGAALSAMSSPAAVS